MTYVAFTFLDHSNEKAVTTLPLDPIAVNGANWPDIVAAVAALKTGVEAVTNGTIVSAQIALEKIRYTNVIPDDGQREYRLIVRYEDYTTKEPFWFTLPCGDLSKYDYQGHSDMLDLTKTGGLALKTAIEANMTAPDSSHSVVVLSVEDTGRKG